MKKTIKFLSGIVAIVLLVWILRQPGSGAADGRGQRSPGPGNFSLASQDEAKQAFVVSEPVVPTVSTPVRDLPPPQPEFLLDREVNPRFNFNPLLDPTFRSIGGVDPLLARQAAAPITMAPPVLLANFDGNVTGTNPHDPVGDVGPTFYIQATNASGGTLVNIINKTTGVSASTIMLDSLGSGNCASGLGDPIVMYDQLAGRWFFSEFSASGNRLCVYVSQTSDPQGSYYAYNFQSANSFPDYPKYGVWHDAYYLGTNESSPTVYALDRNQMLSGGAATYQSFNASLLSGFGFQMITPADADGAAPPPASSPHYFMRHRDTEVHGPAGLSVDYLELFEFDVDWATPANTTFTKVADIPVTEFDSDLCGLVSFNCFPQQGTSTTLDPLREVIMWRLQYRNFGSYEALVANHVTDVNGSDRGGVRWYELRRTGGGSWTLYQEGTYSPDATNRFMGSIAMDGAGNIALAYSVSDSSIYPSIRYTGREAGDPLGTMAAAEVVVHNGTGTSGSNRWGDYSSLNVDPVDDCTFWYTMEYGAGGTRRTRIASFKFDACSTVDFTVTADPATVDICAPADAVYTATVASLQGFPYPVTLSASGHPAGTSANFSTNPVTPTGTSQLTIGNTGAAAAGSYNIDIVGTSPTRTHTATVGLNLTGAVPGAVVLLTPANGAASQPVQPAFTWQPDPTAVSYAIDIATDPAFTNIVDSAAGLTGTSYTPPTSLNSGTTYYWRVRAGNGCGNGAYSAVFSFTTQASSFACNGTPVGFESGIPADWTVVDNSGGTGIVWGTTADATCGIGNLTNGSGEAACADSDAAGSGAPPYDTELVSPPIDLRGAVTVTFDVAAYYRDLTTNGNDIFTVDVWNGSSWVNELTWNEDHEPEDIALDLTGYNNQSDARVRFRYAGDGWDWYAQVDEATLNCGCPIPNGVTDLGAGQSGSDVVLNWTATNATGYDIHASTTPYFTPTPGTLLASTTSPTYTHIGAADDGNNEYYVVVGTSGCGTLSLPSHEVGAFEFAITPGN